MKKYFLFLLFTMVNILSFGYNEDSIWYHCDCHNECMIGYLPIYKSNDTLIYVKTYNDNISKVFHKLHRHTIRKDKICYSTNGVPFYEGYNLEKIPNINDSIGGVTIGSFTFTSVKEFCDASNHLCENKMFETFKYGFINSCSWSTNSTNDIDFKINYVNHNPKTIKYIDIDFIVKNHAGDICSILYNNGSNICHLRCDGPVGQYYSGSWSWDAAYRTTRDASYLQLTKFVITYMDGTKYTLVKELAHKL